MSDADRILSLRDKENEQGYDYSRQERSGLTKRDSFFQNMRIPRQNWNDIRVDYIYYPLKEKVSFISVCYRSMTSEICISSDCLHSAGSLIYYNICF